MLDRKDVEQLKEAQKNNLSVDQIIESAEEILARNELKETLRNTGNEIYYRFSNIIDSNIEEIEKLSTPEEMLDFIIQKSFWEYKIQVEEIEADRLKRIENATKQNETPVEETTPEENVEKV